MALDFLLPLVSASKDGCLHKVMKGLSHRLILRRPHTMGAQDRGFACVCSSSVLIVSQMNTLINLMDGAGAVVGNLTIIGGGKALGLIV